jgi:glycine/serine hydroxymethyltransferase
MQQHFLYRIRPSVGYENDGPAADFLVKYTECKGIATMTDNLVPKEKYKVLKNNEISGLRVGKLEWDTDGMASLNFTDAAVIEELVSFGRDFAVKAVSKEELAGFLAAYTNLTQEEISLI